MLEAGADTKDFLKYMAEDSGNVDESGNYSIQVLGEALKVFGLSVASITAPEMKDALASPQREQAFICNQSSHWLALRKACGLDGDGDGDGDGG